MCTKLSKEWAISVAPGSPGGGHSFDTALAVKRRSLRCWTRPAVRPSAVSALGPPSCPHLCLTHSLLLDRPSDRSMGMQAMGGLANPAKWGIARAVKKSGQLESRSFLQSGVWPKWIVSKYFAAIGPGNEAASQLGVECKIDQLEKSHVIRSAYKW